MGWAALLGVLTGVTRALASLLVTAIQSAQAAQAQDVNGAFSRGLGAVGGFVGLVIWPFVGVVVRGLRPDLGEPGPFCDAQSRRSNDVARR
jgi:hypothetical protein